MASRQRKLVEVHRARVAQFRRGPSQRLQRQRGGGVLSTLESPVRDRSGDPELLPGEFHRAPRALCLQGRDDGLWPEPPDGLPHARGEARLLDSTPPARTNCAGGRALPPCLRRRPHRRRGTARLTRARRARFGRARPRRRTPRLRARRPRPCSRPGSSRRGRAARSARARAAGAGRAGASARCGRWRGRPPSTRARRCRTRFPVAEHVAPAAHPGRPAVGSAPEAAGAGAAHDDDAGLNRAPAIAGGAAAGPHRRRRGHQARLEIVGGVARHAGPHPRGGSLNAGPVLVHARAGHADRDRVGMRHRAGDGAEPPRELRASSSQRLAWPNSRRTGASMAGPAAMATVRVPPASIPRHTAAVAGVGAGVGDPVAVSGSGPPGMRRPEDIAAGAPQRAAAARPAARLRAARRVARRRHVALGGIGVGTSPRWPGQDGLDLPVQSTRQTWADHASDGLSCHCLWHAHNSKRSRASFMMTCRPQADSLYRISSFVGLHRFSSSLSLCV